MASETQMPTSCGGPTAGHRQAAACDDGQPDLRGGGHAELPGSGQRDYLVWLRSMVEAREYPLFRDVARRQFSRTGPRANGPSEHRLVRPRAHDNEWALWQHGIGLSGSMAD
jgi:hypothetical protein